VDELLAGTGLAGSFGMLNVAFAFVLVLVTPAFARPTDSRVAPPARSDNRPVRRRDRARGGGSYGRP